MLDKFGTRVGYAVALAAWSVSSMLHAFARGPLSFGVMRGLLGVSESPAFPAAAKILAEWFPRRERAFAFGFVNAGTNMGAILAPAVVPWLAVNYGWQWAFVGTGLIGFVWLGLWIPLYRTPQDHPRVSPAELALITSDPPEPVTQVPWAELLRYRQAWAFAIGKFLTDSMWWFYMTWLPKFLHDRHGLDLLQHRPAADPDLRHGGHRQHRRRLAVVVDDQAGDQRQSRAQDGDVASARSACCRSCSPSR